MHRQLHLWQKQLQLRTHADEVALFEDGPHVDLILCCAPSLHQKNYFCSLSQSTCMRADASPSVAMASGIRGCTGSPQVKPVARVGGRQCIGKQSFSPVHRQEDPLKRAAMTPPAWHLCLSATFCQRPTLICMHASDDMDI